MLSMVLKEDCGNDEYITTCQHVSGEPFPLKSMTFAIVVVSWTCFVPAWSFSRFLPIKRAGTEQIGQNS